MLSNAPTRHCGWLGFGRRYFGCYGFGCYSFGCHEFGRNTFGCCVFGRRGFGCCGFGCRERSLYWRFWMFFGCYELWMLCFWMLRTLDSTALDASIRSPMIDQSELHWSKYFMKDMILFKKCCVIYKMRFAFECLLRKKCVNVPKICCRWEAAIALVMHPALWEIKGIFTVRLCSRNCTVEWWHQTMLATCKQPHMLCVLCYAVWQFFQVR